MKKPTRFVTNKKGERIAVIIDIQDYTEMLEELEDAEALHEYHEAKASGETAKPQNRKTAKPQNRKTARSSSRRKSPKAQVKLSY